MKSFLSSLLERLRWWLSLSPRFYHTMIIEACNVSPKGEIHRDEVRPSWWLRNVLNWSTPSPIHQSGKNLFTSPYHSYPSLLGIFLHKTKLKRFGEKAKIWVEFILYQSNVFFPSTLWLMKIWSGNPSMAYCRLDRDLRRIERFFFKISLRISFQAERGI